MTDEIWACVEGWPHEVSSQGRVRNTKTGNMLKSFPHKSGYLNVQLWDDGKYKTFMVHRLVAFAFVGLPPSEKHEVAHSDGDRHNNSPSNLRWVLHAENMRDRDRHGTTARGERNGKTKHSDIVVIMARNMRDSGMRRREIAAALGISKGTVAGYIGRRRRKDVAPSDCAGCGPV
jgi:hypothetical protein